MPTVTFPQPSIEKLREEFARNDVRGWIWPWLSEQLVQYGTRRIAGRLSPKVYSPSGTWDDAGLTDLVNAFIVERGIGAGALAKAFVAGTDVSSALRYLEESFRRYVIGERPRTLSRNIFDRLRDVLDHQPDFIRLGGVPPHAYYGLADWEDDPPLVASDDQLRQASRYLPRDVEWVNYASEKRLSPGISSGDLERMIRGLLNGLGLLLSARQIMRIVEERYPIRDEELSDPATINSAAANSPGPLELAEASDLASRAWEAFSPRQRSIIGLMLEDPAAITVREVAERLQISKSTAANELRAIQGRFRLLGVSNEPMQRQVLDALLPIAKAG